MLADTNLLPPPSYPTEIAQAGGKIFFVATDGLVGAEDGFFGGELFVIEGTSPPKLVKDIKPGFLGSAPTHLLNVAGVLYFTADDGEHGRELGRSDSTAVGTRMVADIFPGESESGGPNSSNPIGLTVVTTLDGTKVFFAADNGTNGVELWMADDSGASMVVDLYPGINGDGRPNGSGPDERTFVAAHSRPNGQLFQRGGRHLQRRGREQLRGQLTDADYRIRSHGRLDRPH